MRAIVVEALDGPAAVRLRDVPEPKAGGSDVVIDVRAAGVVFPDVLKTRGLYQERPELPFVLGQECAGVVRSAPVASGLRPGDRVAAFTPQGAFAEVVAVDAGLVLPLPEGVPFEKAACLPLNYLTAHAALVHRGRLTAGETVLVHGAAGGIGTASIQVAKALGARVIGVVSDTTRAEVARVAGADWTVGVDGFRDAVAELTAGVGVDIVVDPVGGDRFTDSLRCLAPEGRLLVVGFTGGSIPTVKVNRLLLTNTEVVGVGWTNLIRKPGFVTWQWTELQSHLLSGALAPMVGATLPLERAAEALEMIEQRRAVGKIVLTLGAE
nr:NADPH:quinone oxidoreductase family protein [Streptomyces sp. S1D4-11]